MEEFIIQSTAWYYMEYLGESDVFLGLTLAAFPAGIFIFAPLIGISELKFQATKAIVIICGLAKILGNLLYAIPVNGYFPLFGRLISGIGNGILGVLYGAVTKCTTNNNRAEAFLYFEGLFTVGAVFGLAIDGVLTFNVNIFGWKINAGNSPGAVLTIAWFILLIPTLFFPRDCGENSKAEMIEPDPDSDKGSDDEHSELTEGNTGCTLSTVCCLYYLLFLHMVIFSMISFYTPLLAVHHLGLGLSHVKLIFINSSLVVLILYIVTYIFLDKIPERNCLFAVIFAAIFSISITFYFSVMWSNAITVNAAYLLLISMIIVSAQYVTIPLVVSLVSKTTPTKHAAFYQSLALSILNMSAIIARMIAGATFAKTPMMYSCLGLTIAWAFGIIWMAFEYRNLLPKP